MTTSDVFAKQRAAIETLLRNQDRATVVPIRQSFDDDDRLSLGIFAKIPDHIAAQIAEMQSTFRALAPNFHYAPRESLHLTVQSVRTIATPATFTPSDARTVSRMVAEVAARHQRQNVLTEGMIALPTSLLITVLYDDGMQELIRELSQQLIRIGLPDNKQYVDPSTRFGNITICRFTSQPPQDLLDAVATYRQHDFGQFEIDALTVASTNAVYGKNHTKEYGTAPLS